jgi:methionyl-tRNA formyltransferase
MGTPEFAIPSLDILLRNEFPVVCVVTAPDKPAGRGQHLAHSPVKCFARDHNIDILQPSDLREPSFLTKLREYSGDLFVVVAFRILPAEVFLMPPKGTMNLHASLLPQYRGAAPINWAIMNGERETGVTTFFIEEKVDTGKIVLQAHVAIGEDETAGELNGRLAEVGAEIVLLSVRLIASGKAAMRSQDSGQASLAPKVFREDCRIDWKNAAGKVHNQIRGLSPRPGAFTYHEATQLKIFRSRMLPGVSGGVPGQVVKTGDQLAVQCGEGLLEILELQQEGKRRMKGEEFMRGYNLERSTVFH